MEKIIEQNGKTFKVRVYYSLGGYNNLIAETESRGYYVSVVPVTLITENGVQYEKQAAFSGTKELLAEVSRKSKKREAEAIALVTEEKIHTLLSHIA